MDATTNTPAPQGAAARTVEAMEAEARVRHALALKRAGEVAKEWRDRLNDAEAGEAARGAYMRCFEDIERAGQAAPAPGGVEAALVMKVARMRRGCLSEPVMCWCPPTKPNVGHTYACDQLRAAVDRAAQGAPLDGEGLDLEALAVALFDAEPHPPVGGAEGSETDIMFHELEEGDKEHYRARAARLRPILARLRAGQGAPVSG